MVRALVSEANATISGSPPPLVMVERSVQTSPLRPIDFHVPNLLGIVALTPVILMLTHNYFVEGGDNWTSFKG